MAILPLDIFVQPDQDLEHAQYQILARIQRIKREFAQNRLYPHLSDLKQLLEELRLLEQRAQEIQQKLPKTLKQIDWEEKALIYETDEATKRTAFFLAELLDWAIPQIEALYEEGQTLQEFIEEQIHVEEVGIIPTYRETGYFLLPEISKKVLHIFEYHLSLFTQEGRILKAFQKKSLRLTPIFLSPQSIKLTLVRENTTLPNPAMFLVESEIEFPFASTLLPVAKRKLQQHLHAL